MPQRSLRSFPVFPFPIRHPSKYLPFRRPFSSIVLVRFVFPHLNFPFRRKHAYTYGKRRQRAESLFTDKPQSPIRIYLAPGGCSGPRLGLALDEPRDEDEVMEQDGFTFCAEKNLWTQIGGVTIDLSYMGFTVEPTNPLPAPEGGSSCGS